MFVGFFFLAFCVDLPCDNDWGPCSTGVRLFFGRRLGVLELGDGAWGGGWERVRCTKGEERVSVFLNLFLYSTGGRALCLSVCEG